MTDHDTLTAIEGDILLGRPKEHVFLVLLGVLSDLLERVERIERLLEGRDKP